MRLLNCSEGIFARGKILLLVILLLPICPTAVAHDSRLSSKPLFSRAPSFSITIPSAVTEAAPAGRLARVTAYWPGEDYYTNRRMTATGVRLRLGFCAVDSSIIPYGSLVKIVGVGTYLAMDTGTAVISRKAARTSGHNREERSALVIDLYFASRKAGELFERVGPKFAMIAWASGSLASN